MLLKRLKDLYSICQVSDPPYALLNTPNLFLAYTNEEISLVCPTNLTPTPTIKREDGWVGLKIDAVLDFSLVGILAAITQLLAKANVSVFAVSTYNTDYIFIKQEVYSIAAQVLNENHYKIVEENNILS